MPRRPTQQERFAALLALYEVQIGDAMLAAFADLRDHADQAAVIAALQRGDIEAAISALHMDAAAFHPMDRAMRDAFVAAGLLTVTSLPSLFALGNRIVVRFNPAEPQAAAAVEKATAQVTGRLLEEQIATIRSLVSERLAANADPKTIALEIVGRINRATGVREGGIIGLSGAQAQYVQTAADELASGDAALMRNYLTRTLRDSRFDSSVRAAIEAEQPLDQAVADRAVQSYANRLLLQRGRTVGLAQAQDVLHSGQNEAMNQALASGGLDGAEVVGDWRTVGDLNVRVSHQDLDGQSKPHGQPFATINGNLMRWPGDMAYGAGPEDIANCRCSLISRIVERPNAQRSAA